MRCQAHRSQHQGRKQQAVHRRAHGAHAHACAAAGGGRRAAGSLRAARGRVQPRRRALSRLVAPPRPTPRHSARAVDGHYYQPARRTPAAQSVRPCQPAGPPAHARGACVASRGLRARGGGRCTRRAGAARAGGRARTLSPGAHRLVPPPFPPSLASAPTRVSSAPCLPALRAAAQMGGRVRSWVLIFFLPSPHHVP